MTNKGRQAMEKALAKETVKVLLAAGFAVTVDDGGDEPVVKQSRDAEQILGSMFDTDEVLLAATRKDGTSAGWIRFIYGNDGYDTINDYTTNLEAVLAPVNRLADRLESGDFAITFPKGGA